MPATLINSLATLSIFHTGLPEYRDGPQRDPYCNTHVSCSLRRENLIAGDSSTLVPLMPNFWIKQRSMKRRN